MIPQEYINNLLASVDIVDVIGRRIKLKKTGANFFALCPFHSENTPSFSVSPSKQFYHCFGCGKHGTAITFLMEYEGLPFREAVFSLADSIGMPLPEEEQNATTSRSRVSKNKIAQLHEVMQRANDFYRNNLKKFPEVMFYLESRGLEPKTIDHFGIGFAPANAQNLSAIFPHYRNDDSLVETGLVIESEDKKRYDRFRNRIIFPIANVRGDVIAFGGRIFGEGNPKYLNSPETILFNKSHELFGFAQAKSAIAQTRRAIIVEGYLDVAILWQYGITNTVAAMGTAVSDAQIRRLCTAADELIFCFDGDAAGKSAAWRTMKSALGVLRENKIIRFAFLPENTDPDEYVNEFGKDAFLNIIENAELLSSFLLHGLTQGLDLKIVEDRTTLIYRTQPLLELVKDHYFKKQLENEVSRLAQTKIFSALSPQRIKTKAITVTLGTRLIRLLVQYPELIRHVSGNTIDANRHRNDPDMLAVLRLVDAYENGCIDEKTQPLVILQNAYTDESRIQLHLQSLLNADRIENPTKELEKILNAISIHEIQMEINELTTAAKERNLNEHEKALLSALVKKLREKQRE